MAAPSLRTIDMASSRKNPRGQVYGKVLRFAAGHWLRQPRRVALIVGLFFTETIADILTPFFAGRLVEAVASGAASDEIAWNGALGTAIVAAPGLGGYPLGDAAAYNIGSQLWIQLQAVLVSIVWSAIVAFVAMLIVKAVFNGARVSETAEADGLDISSHGEHAYN